MRMCSSMNNIFPSYFSVTFCMVFDVGLYDTMTVLFIPFELHFVCKFTSITSSNTRTQMRVFTLNVAHVNDSTLIEFITSWSPPSTRGVEYLSVCLHQSYYPKQWENERSVGEERLKRPARNHYVHFRAPSRSHRSCRRVIFSSREN